jgi:hypothetical protein
MLIETGYTKAIKAENVFPMARAPKKNPEWLATGSGPESTDIHLDKILSALPAEQKLQASAIDLSRADRIARENKARNHLNCFGDTTARKRVLRKL